MIKTMQEFQWSPKVRLIPGTKCLLRRMQGTYIFKYATVSAGGEISLTFVGGTPGHYIYKSVRPDQVRSIIRKAAS